MIRTNHPPARRYYSRYIAHHTKKNYPLLILGALFITGVLLGTLLLRSAGGDTLELLLQMAGVFVDKRRDQSMLQNFLSGLGSSMVFIIILFVSGFCAISHPLVITLPLFRGLGVGFSTASLYASHGAQAIGYVALLMMPGTVLSTIAILICCRESLRLAGSFFTAMGRADSSKEFYSLRIYFARFFICTILCIISAFLEAILYFGFANSFLMG